MNERIKELLTQAISNVDYIHFDKAIDEELAQMYIPDCFAEQFAQLIVAECVKVAMRSVDDNEPKEAWYLIQEHFGVE